MRHVTALANQKGGVGKSSCTYCLARALALAGARVLVLDLDPQANLSRALARDELDPDQPSIADVLNPAGGDGTATHSLPDVLVPTVFDHVQLAPARIELAAAEANLLGHTGREHRLREALTAGQLDEQVDYVLVDCPPALGQLTINALAAADDVLVVTEPEQWSADGMAELRRTVTGVRKYLHPHLAYAGVIVNRYRPGTRLHRDGAAEIERYFTEAPVWTPYIRLTVSIPEAIAAGIGLDQHGSPTATDQAAGFTTYAAKLRTRSTT